MRIENSNTNRKYLQYAIYSVQQTPDSLTFIRQKIYWYDLPKLTSGQRELLSALPMLCDLIGLFWKRTQQP